MYNNFRLFLDILWQSVRCAGRITFINEATDFNTRFIQEEAEVRRKVIRTYFICLDKIARRCYKIIRYGITGVLDSYAVGLKL